MYYNYRNLNVVHNKTSSQESALQFVDILSNAFFKFKEFKRRDIFDIIQKFWSIREKFCTTGLSKENIIGYYQWESLQRNEIIISRGLTARKGPQLLLSQQETTASGDPYELLPLILLVYYCDYCVLEIFKLLLN
ncbi:hypothetical protein [Pyrococcus kukulkanii]|nr:hypothetical protein [Pyrococcus kukulkanii]